MSFSCLPLKPGDHLVKETTNEKGVVSQVHAIFCGQFSVAGIDLSHLFDPNFESYSVTDAGDTVGGA